MEKKDPRIVQRKIPETDKWENVEMKDLHEGDLFRMFEPDGTPVPDGRGRTEYVAVSDPSLFNDKLDIYSIQITDDQLAKDKGGS